MTSSSSNCWHLFTGEFPPDPGGISDYCGQLAAGLADAGADVHVWTGPQASGNSGSLTTAARVTVHREAGSWSKSDLKRLDLALKPYPGPRRIFVQYTPNAFGHRGMNLGFCSWLIGRRKLGDDVRILFHEVRYLERPGDSIARRMLALVQRRMIRSLLRASSKTYITIPYWQHLLEPHTPRNARPLKTEWLPVPSNIPALDDPALVAKLRNRFTPTGQKLIGSFGTFHDVIGEMVSAVYRSILHGHPDRVGLLIGRGGEAFAAALIKAYPDLNGRLIATGGLAPETVSIHLQACDLLLQPYPDGICAKRTTAMAGLANGCPLVTTIGKISEPLWTASGAVALAPDDDLATMIRQAKALIEQSDECRKMGQRGREFYEKEFSLVRLIERLTKAGQGN